MSEKNSRWDEIRKIQIESASSYHILGGMLLILFGVWLGSRLFSGDSGYGSNLFAELLGIFVTVFIIDYLNRQREERRRRRELIDRLLREARSQEPEVARYAFEEMRDRGLMYGEDSILRGANLLHSRPVKVDMTNVRMEGANLEFADFSKSSFIYAYFNSAKLREAELTHSNLMYASLENADLESAKLTHAGLIGANLSGANLLNANVELVHAFLCPIESETESNADPSLKELDQLILPDGSRASKDTDMARFTDENHPDFWRSEDPVSPAYRGLYERRLTIFRMLTEYRPPPQTPPSPDGADPG